MKIWALLRTKQKIQEDTVMEFSFSPPFDAEMWQHTIGELCQALQIGRPVIMQKHLSQLVQFSRTAFLPSDFLETVSFDRFEIELFPEKKESALPY